MTRKFVVLLMLAISLFAASGSLAQCPSPLPAEGAPIPGPLPLFPPDNWWNLDISTAPIDANSASYIAFINNGGTRRLHPDFGGTASPGSQDIYGMPYVVVDGSQPKKAVTFGYWDESDGVNPATRQGIPFYPIPDQAITQAHWIEGGAPGNVDQRNDSDRHLLIVDCTNRYLYELYNVWYDTAHAQWLAGSGAFFDMKTNNRRPDTWTSADAAGLAILPGLVRYDEAWNAAITDIGHAFRVTVRSTNGYVYPASHRAGSTTGALPMGARLRLKASVNGQDPALRTSDPNVQKIFRAMQRYGLIVADNGSDMYITGTFDTRWDNNVLNPAFSLLSASDFDVIQLGWNPAPDAPPGLASIGANPASVLGGASATGTVALTAGAPAGGAVVALSSASTAIAVPQSATVASGASSATFAIVTSPVTAPISATLTASYAGVAKTTTFTVTPQALPAPPSGPPALVGFVIAPSSVVGGRSATATITLSAPAPSGGISVALTSSNKTAAPVPSKVVVAAGSTSMSFTVTTRSTFSKTSATVTASYAEVKKSAVLTVTRR